MADRAGSSAGAAESSGRPDRSRSRAPAHRPSSPCRGRRRPACRRPCDACRCRNRGCRSVSSDQMPAASALPARLMPSGPGNMSGKMREHARAPHGSRLSALRSGGRQSPPAFRPRSCRRRYRPRGTVASVNGSIDGIAVAGSFSSTDVAGAEIMHARSLRRARRLVARHRRKPDQIGVIEFVVVRDCGQPVALDIEIDVAQRFGRSRSRDAVEARQ